MNKEITKEEANANDNNDASVSKNPPEAISKEITSELPVVGTEVTINKTVLSGKITEYRLSKDGRTIHYLVEYEEDEVVHEKAFLSSQITIKKSN